MTHRIYRGMVPLCRVVYILVYTVFYHPYLMDTSNTVEEFKAKFVPLFDEIFSPFINYNCPTTIVTIVSFSVEDFGCVFVWPILKGFGVWGFGCYWPF